MKRVYFSGKFNKSKNTILPDALSYDYRALLLGSATDLAFAQPNLIVDNSFIYSGPFYCEEASKGNYTSTDCNTVLNAEFEAVKNSQTFVCVFSESFSVGTVVELGWAIEQNKEIIILYKEEEGNYAIKSEYWFAIANAMQKSNKIKVYKYQKYDEISLIIKKLLKGECYAV